MVVMFCTTLYLEAFLILYPLYQHEKVSFSIEYLAFVDQTKTADESLMNLTVALSFNT